VESGKLFIFGVGGFSEGEVFIGQIAERHADDGDDHVGNGRPPLEHFHEEFEAEVIDQDVDHGNDEIADDLGSPTEGGPREADVACHPESREEGDGELEHEGGDVGCEGDETQVEHPSVEHEVIEHIVEHPFQRQVQSTATAIAKEFQRHELPKRRIEEVDDRGQQLLSTGFYVSEGVQKSFQLAVFNNKDSHFYHSTQTTVPSPKKAWAFATSSVKPST